MMASEEERTSSGRGAGGALERDSEAARYSARRAQKQYDAADPENRLVADELERRWNQALQRVREIELRLEQHAATQSAGGRPYAGGVRRAWPAIWRRCGTTPMPMRA